MTDHNDYLRISWKEFGISSEDLAKKVDSAGGSFDYIATISRGGFPVATVLSHCLGIPIGAVIRANSYGMSNTRNDGPTLVDIHYITPIIGSMSGLKWLVVDDIIDTGETLKAVATYLRGEKTYAALIAKSVGLENLGEQFPTYYSMLAPQDSWVVFPWEP